MTGQVVGGLDGCGAGWVLVTVPADGPLCGAGADALGVAVVADLDAVVADLESGRMAAAAIDIPIGLAARARATCDSEARRLVGPRRSSVFPAPCAPCSARPPTTRPAPSRAGLRAGDLTAALQHPGQDPRRSTCSSRPGMQSRSSRCSLSSASPFWPAPRWRSTKRTARGRRRTDGGARGPPSATRRAAELVHAPPAGARRTTCSTRWPAPGPPAATGRGPPDLGGELDERGLRMEIIA